MGWFSKEGISKMFKKAKEGAAKLGQLYDKAKDMYKQGKEGITSLPVIGEAAGRMIADKEAMVGKKFQEATGMTPGQFDTRQGQVRKVIGSM
jgi:hypothetical protein